MSRKIDLSVNDGDRGEKGTYRLIKELAFWVSWRISWILTGRWLTAIVEYRKGNSRSKKCLVKW
jgi:hypothetical protein